MRSLAIVLSMSSGVAKVEMKVYIERAVAAESAVVTGILYTLVSTCHMLFVMIVAAQFAMVAVARKPCSFDSGDEIDAAQSD